MDNNIFNSILNNLNENNEFTLLINNNDDDNLYDNINMILEDIYNNINIFNTINGNDNNVQYTIEYYIQNNEESETYNKYYKNCNEINNLLCKPIKIKENSNILLENCFICMENYKCLELKRELPNCKHYFHKKCIDKWLKKKASCPICRDELIK